MNPEDQIKALAELDGWICEKESMPPNWKSPTGIKHFPDYDDLSFLPNYLYSYDAIIPLIQKHLKNSHVSDKFFSCIEQPDGCTGEDVLSRTPAQLSEALLRATGRWKE